MNHRNRFLMWMHATLTLAQDLTITLTVTLGVGLGCESWVWVVCCLLLPCFVLSFLVVLCCCLILSCLVLFSKSRVRHNAYNFK
jgi:hypothetical protein